MKKIVKVIFLCLTATFFGQNSIEKTIGEFTELKVYDLIEVQLIKSDQNKVIIRGENKEAVVIINKNGKLKIKMTLREIFDGKKTKVSLYFTNVDIIDVNEGAKVTSKDNIKQFELDLKAQEGGVIQIPVQLKYLNIKSTTGGTISSTGYSVNQNISVSAGGIFRGEDLQTETTKVAIKASGDAYIRASKEVTVKIRAGGDVFIYGNPEQVNESKVFGGRVKQMEESSTD